MFFCDPCARQKGWPTSWHSSYGTCEVCGLRRQCSDVPSKDLPIPATDKENPTDA